MLKKELMKILPEDIYLLNIVEDNLTDCLMITIDSVTGVDIKTTTRIAKIIKNSEYFTSAYPSGIRLEVSSPSIFDSLTEPFQFKKNIGKKIQIKEFSSNFTKTLRINSVDNAGFNGFEESDDLSYIRFNEIEKANILVEF
tara:strand:- start:288 stop:710 length:423 start_codon:yes stop_codon:yes gene_type:complete